MVTRHYLYLQTQFGEDRLYAISSYRGNRRTYKQTNPQTGPITIHYSAASAQCNELTARLVLQADCRRHGCLQLSRHTHSHIHTGYLSVCSRSRNSCRLLPTGHKQSIFSSQLRHVHKRVTLGPGVSLWVVSMGGARAAGKLRWLAAAPRTAAAGLCGEGATEQIGGRRSSVTLALINSETLQRTFSETHRTA